MDDVVRLAAKCGFIGITDHPALKDFYRAAYNKGIEDASIECSKYTVNTSHQDVAVAIRALEKK